MPSLDEIRTLTIEAVTKGVTEATAQLNSLAQAQDGVSVVSDKSTKSTTSIQNALDKQQKSLDGTYRAQLLYNRSQLDLTMAYNTGLVSLSRFNELSDLNTQRMTRQKEAAELLARDTGKLSEVAGVVESRMAGMGASLGVVGEILSVIGPFGLAAAVGLGAVAVAGIKLTDSANAMGDWARQLQDTSDTINVNVTQLQALNAAASTVNVTAEANATAFERFAVNLGGLRDGTGSLYIELSKVSPSLVSQLSVTKDTVAAWDLLSQAYAKADAQQQALIAHAAFGRGGAAEGRVLQATANAGGIGGLTDQNAANAITRQQLKDWAQLRTEISAAGEEANRNFASTFTGPVLTAEKAFVDGYLALSQAARNFTLSADWKKFAEFAEHPVLALTGAVIDHFFPPAQSFNDRAGSMFAPPPARTFAQVDQTTPGMFPPSASESAGVALSNYKQLISILGAAATPIDLFHEKWLQIQKDLADHPQLAGEAARAQADLNESFQVDRLNANIAALGAAATPAEQLTAKLGSLHLELTRGKIDWNYYVRAQAEDYQVKQQAIDSGRERLGLLTDEEQHLGALATIQDSLSKGFIKSDADMTTAQIVLGKQIQDTSDRMKVQASLTPQLTQLGLDAGNFGKQLDTLASSSLSNLGTGMVDILTKTTDLQTGIRNLELQFIKSLANMLIEMTIVAPLARSLQGVLGGFIPGGLGVLPGGASLGQGGIGHAHGGAIVGSEATFYRYVHPAYFENAPRFHAGGIAGDEVPIVAKRGEGIFTPAQMAALGTGGGGDINIHSTVVVQGGGSAIDVEQARTTANMAAAQIKQMVVSEIINQKRPRGLLA